MSQAELESSLYKVSLQTKMNLIFFLSSFKVVWYCVVVSINNYMYIVIDFEHDKDSNQPGIHCIFFINLDLEH